MHTLVLDIGYQPINAVSVRRAFRYLVAGKAERLVTYEQQFHPDYETPAVVRLTHRIRSGVQHVKLSRRNILVRDRWRCQYCGERKPIRQLTCDHVIPKSRGGELTWTNAVCCCADCNRIKDNQTPEEAGMRLLRKPTKPKWLPVFGVKFREALQELPAEWNGYWTADLVW